MLSPLSLICAGTATGLKNMSTPQKTELDLELEFLPAWAKESSDNKKKYENYRGDEEARPRRGGSRPPRRSGPPGKGGDQGERRGPGGRRDDNRDRRDTRGRDRGPRGKGGRDRRGDRRERPQPPPVELDVRLVPEADGVENIARQIRVSGRAYPVFDIARLVMKSPDRFLVEFAVRRKGDSVAQPLYQCELDGSLWLNTDDAAAHLLRKHFDTFYATEKTPVDPPKGTYTFVAQCGLSGTILGPPNYHDYQKKLVALHQERFARMPFEKFKSRVKIVREEETVKQWIEEQSFQTEYTALNVPEEVKFKSRAEVAEHFKKTHLENVVKSIDVHRIPANEINNAPDGTIRQLGRFTVEDQRRFPIKVVNVLCEDFARHQLQFFKKDKTITHVSVSRPHYLDLELTPVSDGVKAIIKFIDETPKCTRRLIFDALAPTKVIDVKPPEPEASADTEPAEASAETEGSEKPAEQPAPQAAAEPEMSPEQQAVNGDLHWLVHQGHVIEFSNGIIETAKKPRPRPEQQPKKKKGKGPRGRRNLIFIDPAPLLI